MLFDFMIVQCHRIDYCMLFSLILILLLSERIYACSLRLCRPTVSMFLIVMFV